MRILIGQNRCGGRIVGGFLPLILLSIFAMGARECAAQSTDQANADQAQETQREAVCDWRYVPQALPPEPTNPQEKELQDVRGRASDLRNPSSVPLDQPQPTMNGGRSSSLGYRDEIPLISGQAVVVARFKSFLTYLTPSHRSIYTIGKLEVEQVLDPGEQGVSAGQVIELGMGGGTVRLSDGRVISDGLDRDKDYCVEPGHRYLFLLNFDRNLNEFGSYKDWELNNGMAVSYSPDDVARVREGQSALAGLTEAEFLNVIRQAIEQHREQTDKK